MSVELINMNDIINTIHFWEANQESFYLPSTSSCPPLQSSRATEAWDDWTYHSTLSWRRFLSDKKNSQLICRAIQLTCFCMIGASSMKEVVWRWSKLEFNGQTLCHWTVYCVRSYKNDMNWGVKFEVLVHRGHIKGKAYIWERNNFRDFMIYDAISWFLASFYSFPTSK